MPKRGFLSRLLSAPIEKTRLGRWFRDSANALLTERQGGVRTSSSGGPAGSKRQATKPRPAIPDHSIKETREILDRIKPFANSSQEATAIGVNDIASAANRATPTTHVTSQKASDDAPSVDDEIPGMAEHPGWLTADEPDHPSTSTLVFLAQETMDPIHATVRSQGRQASLSFGTYDSIPENTYIGRSIQQHRTSHYTSSSSALMRERRKPQQRRRTMSDIRHTRG